MRRLRHIAFLLVACSTFTATAAAADPQPETIRERAGYIPHRQYQARGAKVVGLIVGDVVAIMGQEGRSGPPTAVGFSSGGGSYNWLYTPAKDGKSMIQNLRVHTGEDGREIKMYPHLDLASLEHLTPLWEVDAVPSLVEIEVNDGLGRSADEAFVASKMTVLDGTKAYPLVTGDVLRDAKRRYESWRKEHRQDIETGLEAARKEVLGKEKATGPRETQDLLHLSWLPGSQRMRVRFFTRVTDGRYGQGGGAPVRLPVLGGPRPQAAALPPPPPRDFAGPRFGRQFGIEYGMSYEFSKTGTLARIESLPVQSFMKELAPPPAPRFPRDPLPPGDPNKIIR